MSKITSVPTLHPISEQIDDFSVTHSVNALFDLAAYLCRKPESTYAGKWLTQVNLENHRRRWRRTERSVNAAVAAHLSGVDDSFVWKKHSIDGFPRRAPCFFCLTANWLRQEVFLGETAVYLSSLWSTDSHLVSPFAATGNLKLLPSAAVGSKRPDWSTLNVIHKQLVKLLSKWVFFFNFSKILISSYSKLLFRQYSVYV